MSEKISPARLLLKALLLFLVCNLAVIPLAPLPRIARLSAYNELLPGRLRLPFGERPEQAYNLSLFSLEAMFASHVLADGAKPTDEYRVILVGDSSVWGFLLEPQDTLAAYLNAASMRSPDGRVMRFYNLGYPTMSLTKDLLLLSQAMAYQPDLVIWLLTLESFPDTKQLASPILQHNPSAVRQMIADYLLDLDRDNPAFVTPSLLDQTLVGQRRAWADVLRLQLYGVLWTATGIDQFYPDKYDPPQEDLSDELSFHDLQPPTLQPSDLALETLYAGVQRAGNVPILFVNEPMYLSQGENSQIRYNFFYPRWAYDQYRQLLAETCDRNQWLCLDAWDLVPASEFTNSAIHMTPLGTQMLAEKIALELWELFCK